MIAKAKNLGSLLASDNPDFVNRELTKLVQQSALLDLSNTVLNKCTMNVLCGFLTLTSCPASFNTVIWGSMFMDAFDELIDRLPYIPKCRFDLSRSKFLDKYETTSWFADRSFFQFDKIAQVNQTYGPLCITFIVNTQGRVQDIAQVAQLRRQGVKVEDLYLALVVDHLNAGHDELHWAGNRDIDFCGNATFSEPILLPEGMNALVRCLSKLQKPPSRLALGRVASLNEFFRIRTDCLPTHLDLSHVRICSHDEDEGRVLGDQEAARLEALIKGTLFQELSLTELTLDASGLSDRALNALKGVCQRVQVKLNLVQPPPSAQPVQGPPQTGAINTPATTPLGPMSQSDDDCQSACENDAFSWITDRLEENPKWADQLSPSVRSQVHWYAHTLVQYGTDSARSEGKFILAKLGLGAPPATLSAPREAFREACAHKAAWWIQQQLIGNPQIVDQLGSEGVERVRQFAQDLSNSASDWMKALGDSIRKRLAPH